MIKYTTAEVVFEEVPDEVTLAINISNCQNCCEGCHSPELRCDIGEELTREKLAELIAENDGITCVCFMGEGNDPEALQNLISYLKDKTQLKVALYSGRENVDEDFYWDMLDYLKIGPYVKEWGPLNSPATNQRMYGAVNINKAIHIHGKWRSHWEDITSKFWKRQ